LIELRNVHLQRERAPSKRFDFGYEVFRGALIAKAQGHVSASGGKRHGDSASESASRSGNDGDLAFERKVWDLRINLAGHGCVDSTRTAVGFA
jgi:hypothetical protein